MKQVFIIVVITLSVAAGFGCGSKPANTEANVDANVAPSQFETITDPNTALAEGNRLLDENQTELAIQAYKQAIKLNPDLAEAHFQLGIAYALLELQYQQSGTVDPDNQDARAKTRSQKEFEKALETYKKWLAANPNDDAGHYNLARTYSKLGKDDEAEKEFRQAVKLKPEDTEYQTELGNILIKLAQYREAIDPLKKAIEIDPSNERAAGLLEDAEAGRQRINYVSKNTNQTVTGPKSNSNSNANSNSNTEARPSEGNTVVKPTPAANRVTKPEIKNEKPEIRGKKG